MHTHTGNHTEGHGLALGAGTTLASVMGYRFFKASSMAIEMLINN